MLKMILEEGTPRRKSSCKNPATNRRREVHYLSALRSVSILSAAPSQLGQRPNGEASFLFLTPLPLSSRNAHSVTCTATQAVNGGLALVRVKHVCLHTGAHKQASERIWNVSMQWNLQQPPSVCGLTMPLMPVGNLTTFPSWAYTGVPAYVRQDTLCLPEWWGIFPHCRHWLVDVGTPSRLYTHTQNVSPF